MSLREVLAELDVKVRGLGAVASANLELDRYVASTTPAISAIEALRVKQAEAAEMASRLAQRIRLLQSAEGDNSAELLQLRVAHLRATDAAREHGAQADALAAAETAAGESVLTWSNALAVGAAALAVAAAAARVFAQQVNEVIAAGAELGDLSDRLNVSTSALQEWGFIAEQNGTSLETLTRGLGAMTRNAAASSSAFRRLGVATRDSSGNLRSQEDIFNDTLTALSSVGNATERAALAQRVFGRAGSEMLGVINQGPEALADLRTRFAELGGGMSEASVAASAAADDAFAELRTALVSLRDTLAPTVIPAITELVTAIADGAGYVTSLLRNTTLLDNGWRLAGATARGFLPQLRALWAVVRFMIAPWVNLVLVIDDVMTGMRGGRSVIASWVESWNAANGRILTFRGTVEEVGVDLLELRANLVTLASVMTDTFGDPGSEFATNLRASADAAIADFRGARDGLANRERERLNSRSLIARSERIAAGGTDGARALDEARRLAASLTANTTINITSPDPEAAGRAAARETRGALRRAADTLPLAGAAG